MSQKPRKLSLTPKVPEDQASLPPQAFPPQKGGANVPFQSPSPTSMPQPGASSPFAPPFASGNATRQLGDTAGPSSFLPPNQYGQANSGSAFGSQTQQPNPGVPPFAQPNAMRRPGEPLSVPQFGQSPYGQQMGNQSVPPFASPNTTRQLGDATANPSPGNFHAPMNAAGGAPNAFSSRSTGALAPANGYDGQGMTGTMKLTQSVKVVQVPVAGQPGRYMTGFLPVIPKVDEEANGSGQNNQRKDLQKKIRLAAIVAAVVLVIMVSGLFLLLQSNGHPGTGYMANGVNTAATATAVASATAQANTILVDPLSQPVHNWPIVRNGSPQYVFKNGAYHVSVNDDNNVALPLLPGETFNGPMAYTVTMQEVQGDDKADFNWFGMVLRYSEHQSNGKTVKTFYCFTYAPGTGDYQFRKYTSGFDNPWTIIWHQGKGKEYHPGHNAKNTVKVIANGKNFTFMVNDKKVGTAQDKDLTSGQIGMIVNLKGFEIAYSNLLLTYN